MDQGGAPEICIPLIQGGKAKLSAAPGGLPGWGAGNNQGLGSMGDPQDGKGGAAGHHAAMEAKLCSKMKYRTKGKCKAVMNITRRCVFRAKEAGSEKPALSGSFCTGHLINASRPPRGSHSPV